MNFSDRTLGDLFGRAIFFMFAILLTLAAAPLQARAISSLTPGQWQSARSGALDYLIYIPTSHGTSASALMLNLHGCAQTPDDLKNFGNWESAANETNMIVVLPKVPNGGKYFGCWDYYGTNHSDKNRDNGPLISLTEQLVADSSLMIDARQVYASGLSSGATEAVVLACLRPDLFAGIGVNSGPILGSSADDLHSPPQDASTASNLCVQLAGNHADAFATQNASFIVGDRDYMVDSHHTFRNAEALAAIYGASTQSSFDLATLPGPNAHGSGTLFSDSNHSFRVSVIVNSGLAHAWAAGFDKPQQYPMTTAFITAHSVDYPLYLAKFLKENNLRMSTNGTN